MGVSSLQISFSNSSEIFICDNTIMNCHNSSDVMCVAHNFLQPFPNTFYLAEHVLLPISNGIGRRKLSFLDVGKCPCGLEATCNIGPSTG